MLDKKEKMHARNRHRGRYDMSALVSAYPPLKAFVHKNEFGNESIDFFDPRAVKALNKALLRQYYGLDYWDIPAGYLCPPVPGRADYIHYIADLLAENSTSVSNRKITCLDIGTGANCIYPILGVLEYGWSFIASDIDPVAIRSATKIVEMNPLLKNKIDLRLQKDPKLFFEGILQPNDKIDITICNPPFHFSAEEAKSGSIRKIRNLKNDKTEKSVLNFEGKANELWCDGGEERFVRNMIFESVKFSKQCKQFTTLVAKQAHLKRIYNALDKVQAKDVRTISMGQGNKVSRLVAWKF